MTIPLRIIVICLPIAFLSADIRAFDLYVLYPADNVGRKEIYRLRYDGTTVWQAEAPDMLYGYSIGAESIVTAGVLRGPGAGPATTWVLSVYRKSDGNLDHVYELPLQPLQAMVGPMESIALLEESGLAVTMALDTHGDRGPIEWKLMSVDLASGETRIAPLPVTYPLAWTAHGQSLIIAEAGRLHSVDAVTLHVRSIPLPRVDRSTYPRLISTQSQGLFGVRSDGVVTQLVDHDGTLLEDGIASPSVWSDAVREARSQGINVGKSFTTMKGTVADAQGRPSVSLAFDIGGQSSIVVLPCETLVPTTVKLPDFRPRQLFRGADGASIGLYRPVVRPFVASFDMEQMKIRAEPNPLNDGGPLTRVQGAWILGSEPRIVY